MIESRIHEFEALSFHTSAELVAAVRSREAECVQILEAASRRYSKGMGLSVCAEWTSWRDAVVLQAAKTAGGVPEGIALIAVGGYGRGELSIQSDIDILLLYREGAPIERFAKAFLYPLWDLGYRLGSSTRTLDNVASHARGDETFLTSVFQTRFLAGDGKLYEQLSVVVKRLVKGGKKVFLKSKLEEAGLMVENAAGAVLQKEPNLKNHAGGLRSVHWMEWLNFAFHGRAGLAGLEETLPAIQYKRLWFAYDWILFLRNRLHFRTGRHEDQLYLEHQLELTHCFSFPGDDEERVKRLLRHYYHYALGIEFSLLWMMEDLANLQRRNWLSGLEIRWKPNEKFRIRNGCFEVAVSASPDPLFALQLLQEFSRGNYRVSYSFMHYLERSAREIQEKERYSHELADALIQLLSLPDSSRALSIMGLSGFLSRLIPPFGRIRHLAILNPYHAYTVDQHSVAAVSELESLFRHETVDRQSLKYLPFLELASKYTDRLWVLKIAILLHDAGKSLPGDHLKNGVEIARAYLKKLPIYRAYKEAILFLIQNHLLLSNVSRRHDVKDSQILFECSRVFFFAPFPEEYLDYLGLLTFSDIAATAPGRFSGYHSELLNRVVKGCHEILSGQGGHQPLAADGLCSEAKAFAEKIGSRYLSGHTMSEIERDYARIHSGDLSIEVEVFNDTVRVRLYSGDESGLFARMCGVLMVNGADIIRADIHTYEDRALDEFWISAIFGSELSQFNSSNHLKEWEASLLRDFKKYREDPAALKQRVGGLRARIRPLPGLFYREPRLKFTETALGTRLELKAADRPALLYDVASLLSDLGLVIRSAWIDTQGWDVHDVFEVEGMVNVESVHQFISVLSR